MASEGHQLPVSQEQQGLGSGNHSVMQMTTGIPQRFVVVSVTHRFVENNSHRVPEYAETLPVIYTLLA